MGNTKANPPARKVGADCHCAAALRQRLDWLYSIGYNRHLEIRKSHRFIQWYVGLRDAKTKAAIARRIERAQDGNTGDVKSVGDGVSEMRVDVGAGYRLYFTTRDRTVIFLLCGGDKSTQKQDIAAAKKMAREI
ncbi:MAG: type II toxin-antitoxin system RelE/ParE family toxin [Azoarcus sp.]|jgi:putative addiction module killer protein|nr:type II toxin-antitoxin system RelE/ParE family toxin [Azoarcus sp.]